MEFVSSPTLCVVFFPILVPHCAEPIGLGQLREGEVAQLKRKLLGKEKKKLTNHICYFLSFLVNFKDLCIASKFVGDIKF